MTWFKIDDAFPEHPKWADLEDDPELWSASMSLWMAIGCYCARNLTDGFISEARCRRVTPLVTSRVTDALSALVGAGFLRIVEGGYQMHDYLEYNPSKSEVKRKREQRAKRQKKYRDKQRNASTDASTDGVTDESSDASTNTPPGPARPGLTVSKETENARARIDFRDPLGERDRVPPGAFATRLYVRAMRELSDPTWDELRLTGRDRERLADMVQWATTVADAHERQGGDWARVYSQALAGSIDVWRDEAKARPGSVPLSPGGWWARRDSWRQAA